MKCEWCGKKEAIQGNTCDSQECIEQFRNSRGLGDTSNVTPKGDSGPTKAKMSWEV